MIDFHTHILPGLDDGAVSIDDSLAMARALVSFGYTTVCCTPHLIKGYYNFNPEDIQEATLRLQADLDSEDIPLELWPGIEYMLDESLQEIAGNLLPLGKTKLVLCEAPLKAERDGVKAGLESILARGFVPLVAHPERTPFFYDRLATEETNSISDNVASRPRSGQEFSGKFRSVLTRFFKTKNRSSNNTVDSPGLSREDIPQGVIYQANLGSFTGYYGSKVQRNAYELLKQGVFTALASDLHNSQSATNILVPDKFEYNPFLRELAEFDGSAQPNANGFQFDENGQIKLF